MCYDGTSARERIGNIMNIINRENALTVDYYLLIESKMEDMNTTKEH